MPKDAADTTLYRLLEAARYARRALLVPLVQRGLMAGDDAVIFAVPADPAEAGETVAALMELTGLDYAALDARAARLAAHGLLARVTVGEDLAPGWALTEEGRELRAGLEAHWQALEAALFADLDKKQRKALRRALGRFSELLA